MYHLKKGYGAPGNLMVSKGGLGPVDLTLCYRCAEYHVGWHVDWTRRIRAGSGW